MLPDINPTPYSAGKSWGVIVTIHRRTGDVEGKMSIRSIRQFVADESGATAIEYGLIVALVSIAMVSFAELMGESLSAFWSDTSTKMSNAAGE